MATDTLSNYTNAQTEKFDKAVPLYLNKKLPLLKLMGAGTMEDIKTIEYTGETQFSIPWQFNIPEGVFYTVENADDPVHENIEYYKMYTTLKKIVGLITLTEETIYGLTGPGGRLNFVNALNRNMKGLLLKVEKETEAGIHTDSSGSLCTCASADNVTKIVTVDNTRFLYVGQKLDGYDNDATPNKDADAITVRSVNTSTTFTAASTDDLSSIDSSTELFAKGYHPGTQNPTRNPTGIESIIDDDTGTFQGLSRNTYAQLRALITDGDTPGTPQALTLFRIIGLLTKIENGSYGELPTAGYGSNGVYNAFYQLMLNSNQPTNTMPSRDGLPKGLIFDFKGKKIPIVGSKNAIANTLFFISKSRIFKYKDSSLDGWDSTGGSRWFKVANKGAYSMRYRKRHQYGTDWPEAHGRLNDITEVTG